MKRIIITIIYLYKKYINIDFYQMFEEKLASIKSIYDSYFESNISKWNIEMCDLYENYYQDMENTVSFENLLFKFFNKMNVNILSKKIDICYFLHDADINNSIDDWYYTRFWKKIIKHWDSNNYSIQYSSFLSKGSEAIIYVEDSSKYTYKVFDDYISMFRESFKLYVLYQYFPKYVPEIPIIGQTILSKYNTSYFYSQTFYDNGSYKDMMYHLSLEENIKIFIHLGNMLDEMQNKLNFIHGDLHHSNICINNDKKPVLIDFSYSSFILNDESYDTDWEVDIEDYLIDKNDNDSLIMKSFTKNNMIDEYYSYCGDLFYFSYNILLYYTNLRKNSILNHTETLLYELFKSFFELENNGQKYNIFEYLRLLEKDIQFNIFFISKSSRLLSRYLELDNHSFVDIDKFYMQFDPKNFVTKMETFLAFHPFH